MQYYNIIILCMDKSQVKYIDTNMLSGRPPVKLNAIRFSIIQSKYQGYIFYSIYISPRRYSV